MIEASRRPAARSRPARAIHRSKLSQLNYPGVQLAAQLNLLRIATEDIQKDYWRLLVRIVETKAYPREWNDWIAMLAMKPGEDPKELERRRDLWVQPQFRF